MIFIRTKKKQDRKSDRGRGAAQSRDAALR